MVSGSVDIVWFKRDFRLLDHVPLSAATKSGRPLLLVAFIDPLLFQLPQYQERHIRFIQDSVNDINAQLGVERLHLLAMEPVDFFSYAQNRWGIHTVYSYQETGIKHTFDRDEYMKEWFSNQGIVWQEFVSNGVQRGLRNRKDWVKKWYAEAGAPMLPAPIAQLQKQSIALK